MGGRGFRWDCCLTRLDTDVLTIGKSDRRKRANNAARTKKPARRGSPASRIHNLKDTNC